MSTRRKGNSKERAVQLIQERAGYLVHRAGQVAIWAGKGKVFTRSNDIFGAFDLEAIRRGSPYTLRTQVTDLLNRSHRRKKIEAALKSVWSEECAKANHVELWSWGRTKRDGFAFQRERYEASGTIGVWQALEPVKLDGTGFV